MSEYDITSLGIMPALIAGGFKPNLVKILLIFLDHGELFSTEIQKIARMKQPTVSLIVNDLKERGWIKEKTDYSRAGGRGRPRMKYSVTVGYLDVIDESISYVDDEIKCLQRWRIELEKLRIINE